MARSRREAGRAPNQTSSVYLGADGRWHGRVSMGLRDDGHPDRRHVTAATERQALAKVRDLERARDSGQIVSLGTPPTVGQWLEHWLDNIAAQSVRRRTLDGYRTYVHQYAIPGIGAHRLNRLQPEHVEALYGRLQRRGLSPSSINTLHRVLRAALNEAVARDRITRNPVVRARPPRLVEREVEPLTRAEARKLIKIATQQPNGARWSVGLALGLRQGEALGLCWDAIDLDKGTLTVRRALQRHVMRHGCDGNCGQTRPNKCPERTGGLILVEPKSRAGRRIVALPTPLVAALRTHRAAQTRDRLLAGGEWQENGFVFCTPTGTPIDPRRDWAAWKELLKSAGVRDVRLHDARHTAATLLLVQGVAPRTVMDVMGWSEQRMLSRYQHVIDELRRDAANQMGSALWAHSTETKTETITPPSI